MAKLSRPLFSDDASGSLASTLTYRRGQTFGFPGFDPLPTSISGACCTGLAIFGAETSGIFRFPQAVFPHHRGPSSSPALSHHRSLFSSLASAWHALSASQKESWNNSAPSGMSGYKYYLSFYL